MNDQAIHGPITICMQGKPKKTVLLLWPGHKEGGGVKGRANFFWNLFFQSSKISTTIKLEGG